MTVGELKARLAMLDDELLVVLSRDREGNGFSPLADTEQATYIAHGSYSGEILEMPGPSYTGDDANLVPALVLWPTN